MLFVVHSKHICIISFFIQDAGDRRKGAFFGQAVWLRPCPISSDLYTLFPTNDFSHEFNLITWREKTGSSSVEKRYLH